MTGTPGAIADQRSLRDRYHPAHPAILAKARPRIDPKAADFIAASPFVVLATGSAGGTDASPRGGPPGFVRVLDPERLGFGDLAGNNRLDSYANLVDRPEVGMLFLVPGVEETLRVNGRATITDDADACAQVAIEGVDPKVAVIVDVEECYIHCAKAVRRSGIWHPSTWPARGRRPSAGEVIVDQYGLEVEPAAVEADLEVGYRETIWTEGGR